MNHVEELTVNVTNNDHRLLDTEHIWLVTYQQGQMSQIAHSNQILTIDCLNSIKDAYEALLLNLTLNHQMLPNEVHFRHLPSYGEKQGQIVRTQELFIVLKVCDELTVTFLEQVGRSHGVLGWARDIGHFAIVTRVTKSLERVVLSRRDMALVRVMLNHFTFELN